MTVFCLVELDGAAGEGLCGRGGDVALRAITLARGCRRPPPPPPCSAGASGRGGGVAAVFFGGLSSTGGPDWGGPGLVAELAAYGVTDVYAVSGIDGYAPLAWARVLQWLMSESGTQAP